MNNILDTAHDIVESVMNDAQQAIANHSDQQITNCLYEQGHENGLNMAHEDVQQGSVGNSHYDDNQVAFEHAQDVCHVDEYGSLDTSITLPSLNPTEAFLETLLTPTELNAGEQQQLDAQNVFEHGFLDGYNGQAADELSSHFQVDWGHTDTDQSSIFDLGNVGSTSNDAGSNDAGSNDAGSNDGN